MDFYSDINCYGTIRGALLTVEKSIANLIPQAPQGDPIDTPNAWKTIPSQSLVYTATTNEIDQPDNKPGYNVLHINGYGSNSVTTAITQIAGRAAGRLYYRNGNVTGWYGSSTDLYNSWRELIDDSGGQVINGSLQLVGALNISNWNGIKLIDNNGGYTLQQSALLTYGDAAYSGDLNSAFAGTYSQGTSANCTLEKHYPLKTAGLCHVIHSISSSPSSSTSSTNNKGVTQIYYPHTGSGFFTRSKPYGQSTFNNWCVHSPHNILADHIYLYAYDKGTTKKINGSQVDVGESVSIICLASAETVDNTKLEFTNFAGKYIGWWSRTYEGSVGYTGKLINEAFPNDFTISQGATHIFMSYFIRVE